jgi:hypothetical protein
MSIEKNRLLMENQIKRLRGELNEAKYPALRTDTPVTVAKNVIYNSEGEFDKIVLTNRYTIKAAEDSGGGYATFAIKTNYKLKKGDKISFNFNLGEGDNYFPDNSKITINGKKLSIEMYNESGAGGEIIVYDK